MKQMLVFTAFALVVAAGCGSQSSSSAPSGAAADAGGNAASPGDASPGDDPPPHAAADAGGNTASPPDVGDSNDGGVGIPDGGPGARLGGPLPVGLYSWNEIVAAEPQMKAVGESVHRLAGPLSDAEWATVLRLGVKVMYTTDPTTDVAASQHNIDVVLNRYGPGGTYWKDNPSAPNQPIEAIEVLNEPNYGGVAPDTYASILVAAYAHIKATWPSVLVVGMSCGNNYASAGPWLQQVFAANPAAATSMDALSFHIYTEGTPPDQDLSDQYFGKSLPDHFASLRSITVAAGMRPDIPFWVTEVGYRIDYSEGGLYKLFSGDPGTITLAQQAAYNIRFDLLALRQNIARVYHMFITDSDSYNGGYFTNSDHSPRPVAMATQQLLSLLNDYRSLEVVSEDYAGGNPFVYRFQTPNRTVVVAWAQTPQTVPIAIRGATIVTDMLGKEISSTTESSYSAALSETPIFLTSM